MLPVPSMQRRIRLAQAATMKILDRYILRTLLVPVGYCLFTFSALFVVWDLFNELARFLDSKTPPAMIALYYGALILPSLEYLVPASLMLGTLYALWHLTRSNELMAIQASGIGFHRIITPCLCTALAATIALAAVKETVGVKAFVWTKEYRRARFKTTTEEIVEQLTYYDTRSHRLWLVEQFAPDRPGVLNGVKVTQERPDGTRVRDVHATKAEWLDGTWWFYDPRIQNYDAEDNPVGEPVPAAVGPHAVREMPDITEAPDVFVRAVREWLFLNTWDMIRYLRDHPDISRTAARQKRFDIHSRLAMPWACLIATLFSIPAGAKSGRQSPLTSIFLAVGFFFAFYALTQVGLVLGKSGALPPWLGAWLSNIVFFVSGIAMIIRLR